MVNNFVDNGSSTNETTANTPTKMGFRKQSNKSEDKNNHDDLNSNSKIEYEGDVVYNQDEE